MTGKRTRDVGTAYVGVVLDCAVEVALLQSIAVAIALVVGEDLLGSFVSLVAGTDTSRVLFTVFRASTMSTARGCKDILQAFLAGKKVYQPKDDGQRNAKYYAMRKALSELQEDSIATLTEGSVECKSGQGSSRVSHIYKLFPEDSFTPIAGPYNNINDAFTTAAITKPAPAAPCPHTPAAAATASDSDDDSGLTREQRAMKVARREVQQETELVQQVQLLTSIVKQHDGQLQQIHNTQAQHTTSIEQIQGVQARQSEDLRATIACCKFLAEALAQKHGMPTQQLPALAGGATTLPQLPAANMALAFTPPNGGAPAPQATLPPVSPAISGSGGPSSSAAPVHAVPPPPTAAAPPAMGPFTRLLLEDDTPEVPPLLPVGAQAPEGAVELNAEELDELLEWMADDYVPSADSMAHVGSPQAGGTE